MTLRVLLATDGSEGAQEAAWLVSQMSAKQQLEVILMTVIQLPEVGGMVSVESWLPELIEREQQHAREIHDQVDAMFADSEAIRRSVIREGLVGHEIVVEAREQQVDLVVIGAKGHTALDRILLGSVSDYVATHAPCSALVVRPTKLQSEPERRARVVVGFDDSESSIQAVEHFSKFRLSREIELDVVAICQVIRTFRQDLLPNVVEARAEMRQAFAKAAATGAQALAHVTPHTHSHVIEAEHVGQAVVDFADSHNADFLVVGDTERGMLGRWFLGSVSRYVLRHASCSIWISR
jgi:nucleotide-binding universal stress UspA family protein